MRLRFARIALLVLVFAILLLYLTIPVKEYRWQQDVSYSGKLTPEMIKEIWGKEADKEAKGISGYEKQMLGWTIETKYDWYGLKPTVFKQMIPGGKATLDTVVIIVLLALVLPLFWKAHPPSPGLMPVQE
ncbi:MAG: hypothetical protein QM703_01630 [Gemmatales bacterium]